jgi:dihydropyrimidinase
LLASDPTPSTFCCSLAVDFVLGPKNESLLQAYDRWRGWADPKVCCDYSFHVGVTWWSEQVREEIKVLAEERGVNSFKMFLAYKDVFMLRDDEVYKVLHSMGNASVERIPCCSHSSWRLSLAARRTVRLPRCMLRMVMS